MRKQRLLGVLLVITMILFGGIVASAQMPPMGPGPFPLHALMALDLSDTQKGAIAALINASETDIEIAMQKQEKIRAILAPVLEAEVFNEENLRAAFQQASTLMEDVMVTRAQLASKIRAILTKEQRQIMDEERTKQMEAMKKHKDFEKTLLNTWLQTPSD